MEQIMVKTEVQSTGEILLYYIDENGVNQEGVLTTINDIESPAVQLEDSSYILGSYEDITDLPKPDQEEEHSEIWADDDVKKLLTFYNDNKQSFISGVTQKQHLWAVACKTMLIGKNQQACIDKLNELKCKYCEVRGYLKKGVYIKWPLLSLCHQAFHDDEDVIESLKYEDILPDVAEAGVKIIKPESTEEKERVVVTKHVIAKQPNENVELMLNLYIKYKKIFQNEHWRRDLWVKIAEEMGEADSEYLQKRFLNHKQHYITLLSKRKECGADSVNWPYMKLFDKIYENDVNFHKKYSNTPIESIKTETVNNVLDDDWSETQKTFLAKYYFDCYDEFEDVTIPKNFLWSEVGRLIDKNPESCKQKYELLHNDHLDNYIAGDYELQGRKPMSIIFDYIISKDVKRDLNKYMSEEIGVDAWKEQDVDEMVEFIHDNLQLFKDSICHYVCWAAISWNVKKRVDKCKKQWDALMNIYKSLLIDKKDNPYIQIDWRYIEIFDQIFDYGMNTDLAEKFEIKNGQANTSIGNTIVKKVIKTDRVADKRRFVKQEEEPETKTNMPRTDPKSTKILEYYLKNKEKFQESRNKLALWDILGKQIGINSTQCAQRFRMLKQKYIEQVQKEVDSKITVSWPYYALCKKVFGYRSIKNKLKQAHIDSNSDEWEESDIKQLISFFAKNFHVINDNIENMSLWAPVAVEIGKTAVHCKEKFVELRKCYRKLKTMKKRNPDMKISWSYFYSFDKMYSAVDGLDMEIEALEDDNMEVEHLEEGMEDDYQCIIVLQDDEDITDISNARIIIQKNSDSSDDVQQYDDMPQIDDVTHNEEGIAELDNTTQENVTQKSHLETEGEPLVSQVIKPSKWTKRAKKRLLAIYINFIRSHKNEEISSKTMWTEIAAKLNRKPAHCRNMFRKLKNSYRNADDVTKQRSPFSNLLEKVTMLKPKFDRIDQNKQKKTYKDVQMSPTKVEEALSYYLEHIDEFMNPEFEKKYLWTQLANHISEPVTKVFNKVNYLKQHFDMETEQNTEFSHLLKEIIAKEVAVNIMLEVNPNPDFNDQENSWTEEETEQLLLWYLSNLDKFKNPKFKRSYLWIEASRMLSKSPLVCSKKMMEIRTQYRDIVKLNVDGLQPWRYFDLCQKIYGTGKKSSSLKGN